MIRPSLRLICHALEFGYIVDHLSGKVLRSFGRHLVRTTADYPGGCLQTAVPGRIASHVGALPFLIDPLHQNPGALLILPSYSLLASGELSGAWVSMQRISLHPSEDAEHEPGDAVRSNALIVPFGDFGWHVPSLHGAIANLRTNRVSIAEPREQRLNRARFPAPTPSRNPEPRSAALAVEAIVGAVAAGAELWLDERWCDSEAEFIASYLEALSRFPVDMRGHVSCAVGLAAPDAGFQIAWSRGEAGLDPDGPQARLLAGIGGALGQGLSSEGVATLPGDPRFAVHEGLVSSTLDVPEFQAHIRWAIREHWVHAVRLRPAVPASTALDPAKGFLPAEAARAMAGTGAAARRARSDRSTSDLTRLLEGIASVTLGWDDLVAALDICAAASGAFDEERVGRVKLLATNLILAKLGASIVPTPAMIDDILRHPPLARALAREVAARNAKATLPVRRALSALAGRFGEGSPELCRAAACLLPRDHRIITDWKGFQTNTRALGQALLGLAAGTDHYADDGVATAAEALIEQGRWSLVRDALQQAAARLGRGDAAPTEIEPQLAQQLRLIATLSQVMHPRGEFPSGKSPKIAV